VGPCVARHFREKTEPTAQPWGRVEGLPREESVNWLIIWYAAVRIPQAFGLSIVPAWDWGQ